MMYTARAFSTAARNDIEPSLDLALQPAALDLELLVEVFVPEGPLILGIDETLERRRGKKIYAEGFYRDPVRSSHEQFVKTSGLRWVCLTLLAPIP